MKKKNNKGFVLVETLVVTAFVAGVLIYLYLQFTNLNASYEESYRYNTVEGLYALKDIIDYLEGYENVDQLINDNINNLSYIDITDCSIFAYLTYCKKLFGLENIKNIVVTHNSIPKDADFSGYSLGFQNFIGKITPEGEQPYRLVAEFNNSTYATVRFGD